MARMANGFGGQRSLRGAWRRYVDRLADHRVVLHGYCRRLTGNVWDGEDLAQDTLVRVFSQLGKSDAALENPRAYLIRTATNLWIDRMRRSAREQAAMILSQEEPHTSSAPEPREGEAAVSALFEILHPQERAAFLLKDVCDLSLEETAAILGTTVGAVKTALHRGRGRIEHPGRRAALDTPPREIVERFAAALRDRNLDAMRALCAEQVTGEIVGGVELHSFARAKSIFEHAHMVMPALGFGKNPRWKVDEYEAEPIVLGFRTLNGVEGLNEVHRLEVLDGQVVRVRTYCFCPETLAVVAGALGIPALPRPHRSPALGDVVPMLLGLRRPARSG